MKRICVCCDGTWNAPDKTQEGVAVATNVVKVAEAIPDPAPDGTPQLVYYDAGIGTKGSWMRRTFDGATGTGMSANIREAYRYLIRHYASGDELYFFGFSRGAFTVRSLAGLIRNSGLLRIDARDRVDAAYTLYRSRAPEAHPRAHEAVLFRRTYAVEEVTPPARVSVNTDWQNLAYAIQWWLFAAFAIFWFGRMVWLEAEDRRMQQTESSSEASESSDSDLGRMTTPPHPTTGPSAQREHL